MKKSLLVVSCLFMSASQLYAGNLKTLGVSDAAMAALESNPKCAVIAQTGEKIEFVNHDGFKIAKSDSHWMRFIAFKDDLPFKAQAIIVDGRSTVSRKIVNVSSCESSVKKVVVKGPAMVAGATPQIAHPQKVSMQRPEGGMFAKPPQKVVASTSQEVSKRPVAEEQKQVAVAPQKKPSKSGFGTRGALAAIDTLNASYATFSPFNGEDKERHGENWNLKARFRPFEYGNLRFGAYGSYSEGESNTYRRSKDRWSYVDYTTYGGGLSGLYDHGDNLTSEMDLGILWQDTESWTPAKNFRSWQDEKQLEVRYKLASDARRKSGELWFPSWETGIHFINPFDVSYSDTNGNGDESAYDNQRIRLWGGADIYDWYLGELNQWRVTPTLNAHLGYLWGKESGYLQGGLGSKLAWRGQEMFDIKLFNPRILFEENGSRIYDFIGTAKVDNIIRAIAASGVKDYKPSTEK